MKKQVNIGIIGCGVIGKKHIKNATESELMNVTAIADVREDIVSSVATEFGIKKFYTDSHALINDPEVEAVVVALPTGIRMPVVLDAMKSGKHVLIEKPIAKNAAEVQQMISARNTNIIVGCCSSRFRQLKPAQIATDLVSSGVLGQIRLVRCRGVSAAGEPPKKPPIPWRYSKKLNSGGIFVNWGCYDLDYILGILGWKLKPRKVLAHMWYIQPQYKLYVAEGSDAETHIVALITCDDGTVIELERGEYLTTQSEDVCQIIGTKGSLRLQMVVDEKTKIIFDKSDPEKGVVSETVWECDGNIEDHHKLVIKDFANAVLKKSRPMTGLEESLVIQKIVDAVYISAEENRPVEIK
ncbi:MAG: Gfo/Idh/MocA family oxidoreductase [Elusimicrobia bacterium]|nr:Gfo/Idh/MocA family oxidoreductase [Elusimicrobiota bacterium]